MSGAGDRLEALVARVLNIPAGDARSARVETTPGWDSLAHLRLLMAVEEEFGVSFDPEEIPELDSFERIAGAVERLKGTSVAA